MIYFLKGIVRFIWENLIVLDINNIGYQVYVTKPNIYHIDDEIFLYTYQISKQEEQYLIGFDNIEEKKAFLLLLKVNGIGPKGALNILKQVTLDQMYNAIKNSNFKYFASLNGVNTKISTQIVLDLKNKIKNYNQNPQISSNAQKDVQEALSQLGFKNNVINSVLNKLDYSKPLEIIIKDALVLANKV